MKSNILYSVIVLQLVLSVLALDYRNDIYDSETSKLRSRISELSTSNLKLKKSNHDVTLERDKLLGVQGAYDGLYRYMRRLGYTNREIVKIEQNYGK